MPVSTKAFLLLGSNVGDRNSFLKDARDALSKVAGQIAIASSIYETAAWGNKQQSPFLNQVIIIDTQLSPRSLLSTALKIEADLGRKRIEKWSPRTIDIDILFYGNTIIEEPDLIIPHPAISSRRFTLVPLAEIAPEFKHPLLKKTMSALLAECSDTLPVELIKPAY